MAEIYTTSWRGSVDDPSGILTIYDSSNNVAFQIELQSFHDYMTIEKVLTSSKKKAYENGVDAMHSKLLEMIKEKPQISGVWI